MKLEQLPLSTLLSQTLVAFTIECDNEAERKQPHRTANYGITAGEGPKPWLTSLVMYENCVKHIPDGGITAGELGKRVRTQTNLGGMCRWRYISIDPKPLNSGGKGIKPSSFIKLTAGGRMAKEIWQPLFGEIEERWKARFGAGAIDELRGALEGVVSRLDPDLPDCMPIIHYGLTTRNQCAGGPEIGEPGRTDTTGLTLYSLLTKALLAIALAYDEQSSVSLAICANVLRVLDTAGVPAKEIPTRAGVSKEAVAMAEGWLIKHGEIAIDGSGAGRVVRLTPKGQAAQERYQALTNKIEDRWREQLGAGVVDRLRDALTPLVGAGDSNSPLFECVQPYPDGWRAKVAKPSALPHFPMILHRGGYPDGS